VPSPYLAILRAHISKNSNRLRSPSLFTNYSSLVFFSNLEWSLTTRYSKLVLVDLQLVLYMACCSLILVQYWISF